MRSGAQPASPIQTRATNMNISPDINVYTCVIGKRATQAKYYISDPSCVVQILEQMKAWQKAIEQIKKGNRPIKQRKSLANFGVQGLQSRNLFAGIGGFGLGKKEQPIKTRKAGDFSKSSGKPKISKLKRAMESGKDDEFM